jgi:hypothetical protein
MSKISKELFRRKKIFKERVMNGLFSSIKVLAKQEPCIKKLFKILDDIDKEYKKNYSKTKLSYYEEV